VLDKEFQLFHAFWSCKGKVVWHVFIQVRNYKKNQHRSVSPM